ncbi:hypothetical protein K402DRAFT_467829 [Aulographum hederae CBS 113979]|uniref:C2H2-type domain-containing protein n=1 Tax=Aulographum hederae CBS 113979 TaxID=1176131 RepID=A0A6G1GJT6_9PEZI|nr:hypothetical protein K402DRAFT_467829 [Aulographum hederae CBS 113979]
MRLPCHQHMVFHRDCLEEQLRGPDRQHCCFCNKQLFRNHTLDDHRGETIHGNAWPDCFFTISYVLLNFVSLYFLLVFVWRLQYETRTLGAIAHVLLVKYPLTAFKSFLYSGIYIYMLEKAYDRRTRTVTILPKFMNFYVLTFVVPPLPEGMPWRRHFEYLSGPWLLVIAKWGRLNAEPARELRGRYQYHGDLWVGFKFLRGSSITLWKLTDVMSAKASALGDELALPMRWVTVAEDEEGEVWEAAELDVDLQWEEWRDAGWKCLRTQQG